jgi:hypothetical protein
MKMAISELNNESGDDWEMRTLEDDGGHGILPIGGR